MSNTGPIQTGKLSLLSVWLLFAFIVGFSFTHPKWKLTNTESSLGWDVFTYYAYVPSFFIYHDLESLQGARQAIDKYEYVPPGSEIGSVAPKTGNYISKVSMGQSILLTPWFAVGHVTALLAGYDADGYSKPYLVSVFFGCLVYVLIGLLLVRWILRQYFPDVVAAISILILVLNTNFLNYTAFDVTMTHAPLFTLYALLLYASIRWHRAPSVRWAVVIGIVCGLQALTRPTEAICFLIPLLWGIYDKQSLQHKLALAKANLFSVLAAIVACIGVGSLQLIYWKVYSGDWLYYSYGEEGFSFLSPYLIDGLFSFRKGWLLYSPSMVLAVVGLVGLYRKQKSVWLAITVFSLLNLYIVFSWDIWWYGGSFGARAMVQSLAVWMLPLGASVNWLYHRRRWLLGLAPLLAYFAFLNIYQTYHAHSKQGLTLADGMTRKYYFETFIKLSHDPANRRWLDHKWEGPPTESFARSSRAACDGGFDFEEGISLQLCSFPGSNQVKPDAWYRGAITYHMRYRAWNDKEMAQLGVCIMRDGECYRRRSFRLDWLGEPNNTYTHQIDVPASMLKPGTDSVVLYLTNPIGAVELQEFSFSLLENH